MPSFSFANRRTDNLQLSEFERLDSNKAHAFSYSTNKEFCWIDCITVVLQPDVSIEHQHIDDKYTDVDRLKLSAN